MEDKKGSNKVKTILFIIATAAILALVSMMPVIASAQTNVSIGNASTAYCNTTTVPIMINVTDPTGLGAATINLTYNPNVCVVTDVVKGPNSFDSLTSSHPWTNTSGYVRIVASQSGSTGVGPGLITFANVTLHAIGTEKEKSPLNLTIVTLRNNTGTPLEYSVNNGTFTVKDITPPASISGLANTTGNFWINWTWTNPLDADFNHTMVYINGSFVINVSKPLNWYNATYSPHAMKTISTHTVDTSGNINLTWINQTTMIPNNVPVLEPIGEKLIFLGLRLTIDANATDLDGDILTYSCNRTDWFTDFNPAKGKGNWTPSAAGTYYVDFGVADGYGGVDNETVKIIVKDITPPVVTNATASPQFIPEDTDFKPLWGENSTLNVKVTDQSNVTSVTINLSSIGRSANQLMININGTIWSVTTNASAGTAIWNGSAYVPHSLKVNATDEYGNSNTNVSINLTVILNGDVSGDHKADAWDCTYLARHLAMIPGYGVIHKEVAEVSGDGEVDAWDCTYLARHLAGIPGYELLK